MVGLIVFANQGGLGIQTKRLAEMLNPDRVLILNTTGISQNKEQNYHWYEKYPAMASEGYPPEAETVLEFLEGLTHVICCENPPNFNLVFWCKQRGIKLYCQSNYEFCENLAKPYLPVPDKFLMPSYWKLDDMKIKFGEENVQYLPPPIDPKEFVKAREINLTRSGKPRFLHIIGTVAYRDRNGTLDLLEAVKSCKEDFELVVKTQHELELQYKSEDPRVTYEIGSPEENVSLYEGFDALILPRRYGGLSLTTNEALMSALPVIMPDISPNDKLLPKAWLVEAERVDSFLARSLIAVYSVNHKALAEKIDWFAKQANGKGFIFTLKEQALKIGLENFSPEVLKPQYLELFNDR